MKKYSIYPMQDEQNIFFCVYEELTKQAIDFFYFHEDAEACAKFFEKGGAFAGFTPRFMLTEVYIPVDQKDLDRKFQETFKE